MSDKKYQVFISSTYSDLIEERRKILDILLMADCIPSGMEAFVATDNEQFEVIKRVIDLCDYYVLIIGKRYGSVSPITGKSYTEMEYDYAKSKDIPILVFAIDTSVVLNENKIEIDLLKIKLLEEFRSKAINNRLASIWRTPEELITSLAVSIMKAKYEIPRVGWQRATEYNEATLMREISDLAKENKQLQENLKAAHVKISTLNEQNNMVFAYYDVSLKYHWSSLDNVSGFTGQEEVKIDIRDIFVVITTEMINISLAEDEIESIIIKRFISSSYFISLDDKKIVNTILNRFMDYGLLKPSLNVEKVALYWELTQSGKTVRNNLINSNSFLNI